MGFKTVRIRRIYDKERSTIVYVAYSNQVFLPAAGEEQSAGRFRTSVGLVTLRRVRSVLRAHIISCAPSHLLRQHSPKLQVCIWCEAV